METARRTELAAEIAELQDKQLESFAAATFGGFTPEQNTAHNKRSDHMEALQRELNLRRNAPAIGLKITSR